MKYGVRFQFFLSFNITHIRGEMNSMVDRLVVFSASPTRKLLSQKTDCTFMSIYRFHFPNNEELGICFPDDESICSFLHNEPIKRK
jgi:hypothetical protein